MDGASKALHVESRHTVDLSIAGILNLILKPGVKLMNFDQCTFKGKFKKPTSTLAINFDRHCDMFVMHPNGFTFDRSHSHAKAIGSDTENGELHQRKLIPLKCAAASPSPSRNN